MAYDSTEVGVFAFLVKDGDEFKAVFERNDGEYEVVTLNRYAVDIELITSVAYTFILEDRGKEIEGSNAADQTFTIPNDQDVAFEIGTMINVRQVGAGRITIAAAPGVTIRAPNGAKTAEQWATLSLLKRDTDEWVVSGDSVV